MLNSLTEKVATGACLAVSAIVALALVACAPPHPPIEPENMVPVVKVAQVPSTGTIYRFDDEDMVTCYVGYRALSCVKRE